MTHEIIRSTEEAISTYRTHGRAARKLRDAISQVPPDELSQTDLLAMRAGMIRNLETHEKIMKSVVDLLTSIVESHR